MKLEITTLIVEENGSSIIVPIDNVELFEHCYGTELGSSFINSCTLDMFEERIKPLLIMHGVSEFEIIRTNITL